MDPFRGSITSFPCKGGLSGYYNIGAFIIRVGFPLKGSLKGSIGKMGPKLPILTITVRKTPILGTFGLKGSGFKGQSPCLWFYHKGSIKGPLGGPGWVVGLEIGCPGLCDMMVLSIGFSGRGPGGSLP